MNTLFAVLLLSQLVGTQPNTTTARTLYTAPKVVFSEPDPMDLYLDRLVWAESRNHNDVVILDVNGEFSYSCLQFQEGTFKHYSAKYGLQGDIMDCALQRRIARLMLREPGGWKHWRTSVETKVGLPPT